MTNVKYFSVCLRESYFCIFNHVGNSVDAIVVAQVSSFVLFDSPISAIGMLPSSFDGSVELCQWKIVDAAVVCCTGRLRRVVRVD